MRNQTQSLDFRTLGQWKIKVKNRWPKAEKKQFFYDEDLPQIEEFFRSVYLPITQDHKSTP